MVEIRPGDHFGGGPLLRLGTAVDQEGFPMADWTGFGREGAEALQAGEKIAGDGLAGLGLDGEQRAAVFNDKVQQARLPKPVSELVSKAMSVDKMKRFQNMEEIRIALEKFARLTEVLVTTAWSSSNRSRGASVAKRTT